MRRKLRIFLFYSLLGVKYKKIKKLNLTYRNVAFQGNKNQDLFSNET